MLTERALENYAPIPEAGCWIWLGPWGKQDYGKFSVWSKAKGGPVGFRVHRLFYEHYHGPIPDGLMVRHKCDTPSCVNPDHLDIGDNQANVDDRTRRMAARRQQGVTP